PGRAERGRRYEVGDRLAEGAEHHVEDAPHHLEISADRCGITGVDKGAVGDGEAHRSEGSAVDGHVGEQVLDGDVARGDGRVLGQVGGAGGGGVGVGEVEVQVRAVDGETEAHPPRYVL